MSKRDEDIKLAASTCSKGLGYALVWPLGFVGESILNPHSSMPMHARTYTPSNTAGTPKLMHLYSCKQSTHPRPRIE